MTELKEVEKIREKYGKDTDNPMLTEFLFYAVISAAKKFTGSMSRKPYREV